MKNTVIATALIGGLLFVGGTSIASAQTPVSSSDTTALQSKIEMLMKQIESLKTSAAAKKGEEMMKKDEYMTYDAMLEAKDARQLAKRQLRVGDKGDDVRTLQETLSTDPEIYPEGLITGTFGPLTEKAVRRFQKKHELEAVGEVGPKTREILNRFLAEGGAGKSGVIPPGLLRNSGAIVIHMTALNDSGLKGIAKIKDNAEGKAVVRIKLHKGDASLYKSDDMMVAGATTTIAKQPAHIHLGSCATPGAVKYALSPVVAGESETVLTVSSKDVMAGLPLMINVHKSAEEASVHVSCGDITARGMMMKYDAMMMSMKTHSVVTLNTAVSASSTIGTYLVAGNGMTVYRFTKDTAGASNCAGDCIAKWPAYRVSAGATASAGAGVTGTVGTLTRADGTIQATYNGAPLYFWVKDMKAGDTMGQNVNGVWFVVNP